MLVAKLIRNDRNSNIIIHRRKLTYHDRNHFGTLCECLDRETNILERLDQAHIVSISISKPNPAQI